MQVLAEVLPYAPLMAVLVALLALVVSVLMYRSNRRGDRTTADDRHNEAGPQVEVLRGSLSGQTVRVWLQLVGGPPTTDVTISSGGTTCTGISGHRDALGPGSSVFQPGTHPLERIDVYGQLCAKPQRDSGLVLPVTVKVEESSNRPRRWWRRHRPRRWTRHVSVPITFPPQIY